MSDTPNRGDDVVEPEEPAVDDDALTPDEDTLTPNEDGAAEPVVPAEVADEPVEDEPASVRAEPAPRAVEAPVVADEPTTEAAEAPPVEPAGSEVAPVAETPAPATTTTASPVRPARRPRTRQGDAGARPTRRSDEPKPVVRAQAKYVRSSARKARLVCDHIRGKSVEEARSILAHIPRSVSEDWQKLLESAVANAEHNHELLGDDLKVLAIYADEGPTLKRFRPRAMGRASRIRKRTSHLTIQLTPKD